MSIELSERIRRNIHPNLDGWIARLMTEAAVEIERLDMEVDFLRRYGNRDCTGMADAALEEKRRTGKAPFEC